MSFEERSGAAHKKIVAREQKFEKLMDKYIQWVSVRSEKKRRADLQAVYNTAMRTCPGDGDCMSSESLRRAADAIVATRRSIDQLDSSDHDRDEREAHAQKEYAAALDAYVTTSLY